MMPDIEKYNETRYIKDRALPGESFRQFIIRIRDGNNKITITHLGGKNHGQKNT